MEKPFDVKDLVKKLKDKGLDVAEDAAKLIVNETLDWAKESLELSENKLDDMLLIALPKLKELALEQIDKIDGVNG